MHAIRHGQESRLPAMGKPCAGPLGGVPEEAASAEVPGADLAQAVPGPALTAAACPARSSWGQARGNEGASGPAVGSDRPEQVTMGGWR